MYYRMVGLVASYFFVGVITANQWLYIWMKEHLIDHSDDWIWKCSLQCFNCSHPCRTDFGNPSRPEHSAIWQISILTTPQSRFTQLLRSWFWSSNSPEHHESVSARQQLAEESISAAYRHMFQILQLHPIRLLMLLLVTWKFPFAIADGAAAVSAWGHVDEIRWRYPPPYKTLGLICLAG